IYLLQWHISDYKAAITLQQHIGSKVTQLPYLNLVIKKNKINFPIFSFNYDDDEYLFIANYINNKYLHTDFLSIDYFLIPYDDTTVDNWHDIYNTLKKIPSLLAIHKGNEKTKDFISLIKNQIQLQIKY